jgi:thioredoxin 1
MRHPVLLPLLTAAACLISISATAQAPQEEGLLVGDVTREQIEEAVPDWAMAESESAPDPEAARALAAVERGAEVTVFLGTWCGDSRREVPRLWKALDLAGPAVPFEIHYIGVDHGKREPGGRVPGNDVRYVPTFIVRRNGQEVGRIVEQSPGGVEKDLLALLTGRSHGLITARTDLGAPGSSSR